MGNYKDHTDTQLLQNMAKHYFAGEDMDTEITSRCQNLIQPSIDEGNYTLALNKVVEFFGEFIDISQGASMLVSTLTTKIKQTEQS